MTDTAQSDERWQEGNHRALSEALVDVQCALERHIARALGKSLDGPQDSPAGRGATPPGTALATLCEAFGLSPFERDVLLVCAGVEMDARFAALCAAAQGDPQRLSPTFSLAMAALPEPHWDALTPTAPLRRARLIEVGGGSSALTLSPLRIDERILHFLAGVSYQDERLAGLIEPAPPSNLLPDSHQKLADQLGAIWARGNRGDSSPILQICGEDGVGKHAIAAATCAGLGLKLSILAAEALPASPAELEPLLRLWEREALLTGSALLLDCDDIARTDTAQPHAILRLSERLNGHLFISSRERQRAGQRPMFTIDVPLPTTGEQRTLWQAALGPSPTPLHNQIDTVASQFRLSSAAIRSAGAEVLGRAESEADGALWNICRLQARTRLDDLAQRIETAAGWNDLILPNSQRHILSEVAAHVRQRAMVYERWGFAGKGARGLGISALFAGASGTGKTMAAEALAEELRLDLYRIDLSSVVSKYIGETEKNLRRIFDAAEQGGAILLFDEADALFGKRSEVKDSHDRYANIEVSYLLQRMETYRGLAILTTNLRSSLDTAFLRRLRFVVQFPFPDSLQRAEIWQRIFPRETPIEALDYDKLARLNVAGGNIRSIAVNAAFLAADSGHPVRMTHLLRAARSEYAKLEKTLADSEVAGWV